jgi:hypothetical protein
MHWKRSATVLASGAAASFGLVWLTRMLRRAPVEREEWDSPPEDKGREPGELPKAALAFPDDVEDDFVAAEDARHDIGEEPLDLDTADEPEDVDVAEGMETVHAHEHPRVADEPYDALDADDLGTEWLFRATEASPPERPLTPDELIEQAAREANGHKS